MPHDVAPGHSAADEAAIAAERAFIDGFRAAGDKRAFLELAQIPFELGELKLMQVQINDSYDVGSASPGFGQREMVYHPLPGTMIGAQTSLHFVYVAADRKQELHLASLRPGQGRVAL